MYTFLCLASWLTLGWISSRMALRRGRNPSLWFVLGVILGVIAIGILYFLPSKQKALATATENSAPSLPLSSEVGSQPPEKLWYYLDTEKVQYGPMSVYALQEAWDDDKLTASTYLWNEDMENWTRLEDLPDLHARIRRA